MLFWLIFFSFPYPLQNDLLEANTSAKGSELKGKSFLPTFSVHFYYSPLQLVICMFKSICLCDCVCPCGWLKHLLWRFLILKYVVLFFSKFMIFLSYSRTSCIELNCMLFVPAKLKIMLVKKSVNLLPSRNVCSTSSKLFSINCFILIISMVIVQGISHIPSRILLIMREYISMVRGNRFLPIQNSRANLIAFTSASSPDPSLTVFDAA